MWAGAGRAGEDQHLTIALLDHLRDDRPEEVIRRFDATDQGGPQVVDPGAQEPADDDAAGERGRSVDATEPVQRSSHQPLRRLGLREVTHALDSLDGGTQSGELLGQAGGGIADDQVVPPIGEHAAQLRPDVAGAIADQGHPAGPFGHGPTLSIDMIHVNSLPSAR